MLAATLKGNVQYSTYLAGMPPPPSGAPPFPAAGPDTCAVQRHPADLDLSHNPFGREGIDVLATFLAVPNRIRRLHLANTGVSVPSTRPGKMGKEWREVLWA